MDTISWKFIGFLYTLLALVLLSIFGKDLPYGEMVIGGLIAVLTGQGRDLYRSTTGGKNGKETITK